MGRPVLRGWEGQADGASRRRGKVACLVEATRARELRPEDVGQRHGLLEGRRERRSGEHAENAEEGSGSASLASPFSRHGDARLAENQYKVGVEDKPFRNVTVNKLFAYFTKLATPPFKRSKGQVG